MKKKPNIMLKWILFIQVNQWCICNVPEDIKDLSAKELHEKINKASIGSYRKYLIFNVLAINLLGEEANLPRIIIIYNSN